MIEQLKREKYLRRRSVSYRYRRYPKVITYTDDKGKRIQELITLEIISFSRK